MKKVIPVISHVLVDFQHCKVTSIVQVFNNLNTLTSNIKE